MNPVPIKKSKDNLALSPNGKLWPCSVSISRQILFFAAYPATNVRCAQSVDATSSLAPWIIKIDAWIISKW